jgi:hypothetical protein
MSLPLSSGHVRCSIMRVFLDFEASSLRKNGFPVEVGWVFEDGVSEGHLIRPAPGWTDWDPAAEAIHGFSRQRLDREGEPHDAVARRMVEALGQHDLYASAPSWDGKWLSLLLRAAGFPRHTLRLRDTELAQQESAAAILADRLPPQEAARAVAQIMLDVREEGERRPIAHRAVDDAEEERRRWLEVCRLARERRPTPSPTTR